MTLNTSTLRPGFLVSLRTSVTGIVSYDKKPLETEGDAEEGVSKTRWETERTIADVAEHELATKTRNSAARAIRSVCTQSAFGLLCPEADADKLAKAISKAREAADAFNMTARLGRIAIYVITGRIAADDVEALRAINSEVRGLMEEMQDGIKRLDVKAVREAASKAKEVGAMLSPDAQARVQIAVETARQAAKTIAQSGEAAAQEIDTSAIAKITDMRTAFLDLDSNGQPIAAPAAQARAVDFEPAKPAKAVSFIERSQPPELD